MTDWNVGDKAVEVITLNVRGEPRMTPITITKVARKWVSYTVDDRAYGTGRFDIESNWIDGGRYSTPGRVYRTAEDYQRVARIKQKWDAIRRRFPNSCPDWLTENDIDLIATMFRLNGGQHD